MKILCAGPVQGHYTDLFKKAEKLGSHWIVAAGDFGIFPDPNKIDRGARPFTSNEFARRYVGALPDPINVPVLTVAGAHDDNRWLDQRKAAGNTEILSNVHWLAQGYRTVIGFDVPVRVTGLGRVYSEMTYRESPQWNHKSHRHYTRRDVERACSSGPTDLLVLHEHLDAPGLRNVVFATRPKLILTCYRPKAQTYESIQGIPVLALDRQETRQVVWAEGQFVIAQ
jgi:hypothetical protein